MLSIIPFNLYNSIIITMGRYAIYHNKEGKEAVFNDRTKERISQWWDKVHEDGLAFGESEYYIAETKSKIWAIFHKDVKKMAIFHKNNPNEPITQWWDNINAAGLVEGKSEYYLAQNKDGKWAIFHKDNPNEPITQWWDYIYVEGLVDGRSEYYVAKNEEGKYAIFHKDNPNEPITQWWNTISLTGLVRGQTDYYVAQNKNGDYAIFHKDNPYEPISKWWKNIKWKDGLVGGAN